ncbi:MAG: glycine zipper domain-containing protein [Thermoguttaceae bacterium]|jgi:hypothetical protein
MISGRLFLPTASILIISLIGGCQSPYKSDQGALLGGVLGAGTGAAIGSACHNPLAGAAIGAGVGTITGAAVGSALDEQDARNRAMIAQQLGRQVSGNPVTIPDVINMTRAGVDEELIVNHVRIHGVAAPLQAQDVIVLQQQGVSKRVIATMQEPPVVQPQPMVIQQAPPPAVIVEEYPYGRPYPGPPYYYYRRHW